MQNAWLKKKYEDEADESIDNAKEEYVAELLDWISETLPDHPTEQILGILEYEYQQTDGDWDIEEILGMVASRLPGNHHDV